ncbi:MAG TPA: hypothetical protein VN809_00125, partial [Telmatospirillum sp.]|nr:hypothetical protein [Telmatospirillum sp.]
MIEVLTDPVNLSVGDRFSTRGRRVFEWQIESIERPPNIGPIITFAEIDGIARVQIHVSDIVERGFSRVEDTGLAGRI